MDGRGRKRIRGPFAIQPAQQHNGDDEFGKVLGGDLRRDVGEQVHSVDVVRLVWITTHQAGGSGRGGPGLARQALEALLLIVGHVDQDNGGHVVSGGLEEVGDLGKTRCAGSAHMDCGLGSVRTGWAAGGSDTLVEGGEDALEVRVDVGRGRLDGAWEVTRGHIGGRGAGDGGHGQRLPAHVFVVGAAVNVYDIAGAMLHLLHSCGSDQLALVSAMGGASRSIGRVSTSGAKRGVVVATGGCNGTGRGRARGRGREGAIGMDVERLAGGHWRARC